VKTDAHYRAAIAHALSAGSTFAGLHATSNGDTVRSLLADPEGTLHLESVEVADGVAPTIVDLAGGAGWDEREAADLHDITFSGHAPLRPLVEHHPDLTLWTVPVNGDDAYQVAVGPIHAGVIESGHFRFHLVGERILLLDTRLFYKHRGLERAAEGRSLEEGLPYVQRACAACSVSSPLAYAQACEQALGLTPSPELSRTRTLLLELERLWSHLNDIAAVCAGVGFAAGNMRFAELTERSRSLNAAITGDRFLRGAIAVGRSTLELDAATTSSAMSTVAEIGKAAASTWRELLFNRSFQDRLRDVGVVNDDDVRRLGVVGPAARAAGVALDVRAVSPTLAYHDFAPVVPEDPSGDVRARLEQRALELEQTFSVIQTLLEHPHRASTAEPTGALRAHAAGRVESPRGATSCVVEQDDERIVRLRLRTGSYANWPAVAFAAAGEMLPDFPLINKSFELCYACTDR
jgi:Ni,Fe-hydrogenase III large subunit